jgi:PEP-CTERM motif
MRSSIHSIVLVAGIAFAGSSIAHADLITLTVSQVATGTLGDLPFSNERVTFTGSFTTEALAACQDISSPNFCVEDPGLISLDETAGLMNTSVSIDGLGVFGTESNYAAELFYSGNFADATNIEGFSIGDVEGRLFLPTGNLALGDNCFINLDPSVCPLTAFTTGGDLTLSSVSEESATRSLEITSETPIPEPGTLTLLSTGLIGAAGILRRRLLG